MKSQAVRGWSRGLAGVLSISAMWLGACGGDSEADLSDPVQGGSGGTGAPDAAGGSGGDGATGGTGGATEDGGLDASVDGPGGTSGTGGADASTDAPGDVQPDGDDCVHTGEPVIDPNLFPACTLCEEAHCVPSALLPAGQTDLFADCNATSKCVPDFIIASGGDFLLPSCRSLSNAEGRCLSTCLPDVAAQADWLPQDSCEAEERCVPCFDPLSGEETGVCSLSCDTGPAELPVVLSACCDGIGLCTPSNLVPSQQQSLFGQDSCTDASMLCVPTDLTDPTFIPDSCRSTADAEGRCLPSCLPGVGAMAGVIPQDTCADAHLCVPCYDPLSAVSTGVCELNGDSPVEPPKTFDACCDGEGKCIPASMVPASQQSLLGQDTCTGASDLCAPTVLLDPGSVPDDCRSLNDAEGRCLPTCLPDVEAMQDMLPQDSCEATERCVPCYDPFTSDPTGVCSINGDAPTEPPKPLDLCCDGVGVCVPSTMVPTEQQSMLGQDTCVDASALCLPTELLDATFIPDDCDSVGGGEGRCMAACLPAIQQNAAIFPQDSCEATHRCAPCHDPITGVSTGICELNGDVPAEPPYTFPPCCSTGGVDRGTCVPESLVPAGTVLEQQSCEDAWACAPTDKLVDPTYTFPTCSAGILGAGACLPGCFVNSPFAWLFTQGTCGAEERCVACSVFGSSTGACD